MSDNLQKSIAAMAAAMNVNLNVPISGSATAGIKSPAGSSVAGSNVAPSPRRSPSTTGNGQPADRSSQALHPSNPLE
uniref:Uncharacterized protein n=1 Tax=Ditylenchus dipsaci TaxID=166011 RepID=A0A915CYZ4_9BILA